MRSFARVVTVAALFLAGCAVPALGRGDPEANFPFIMKDGVVFKDTLE